MADIFPVYLLEGNIGLKGSRSHTDCHNNCYLARDIFVPLLEGKIAFGKGELLETSREPEPEVGQIPDRLSR